jgi:nucleotide-binding universal stress UspA family protein
VAMADPDDAGAREAVFGALGPASCVVKADPVAIDSLLAEIWADEAHRRLDVRVCTFPDPVPDEVQNYAQALGDLLDARVGCLTTAGEVNALAKDQGSAACDLVIFGKRRHPLIQRLLSRCAADDAQDSQQREIPFAVLVARGPRWPLRSILLVLWGGETDQVAVDWAIRLAQPSGSAVTVLAVVPPVPAMYGRQARLDQGLPLLLSSATPLGQQMGQAARRLVECEIEGTLKLRQGPPDWQICCEIVKGDYDLIALAAKPCRWWLRWLEGDVVLPLLSKADRPLLIARPKTA